jgi:hypothetical protein
MSFAFLPTCQFREVVKNNWVREGVLLLQLRLQECNFVSHVPDFHLGLDIPEIELNEIYWKLVQKPTI